MTTPDHDESFRISAEMFERYDRMRSQLTDVERAEWAAYRAGTSEAGASANEGD